MKTNWRVLVWGVAVILLIAVLKVWLPPPSQSADVKDDAKVEYFTLVIDYALPFDKAVQEPGIHGDGLNPCIVEENFPNQRVGKVNVQCAKFCFERGAISTEVERGIKGQIEKELKGKGYSPAGSREILAFARDHDISELSYVISVGDSFFDKSSGFHRSVMLWKNKCNNRKSLGLFMESGGPDLTEYWFLAVKD